MRVGSPLSNNRKNKFRIQMIKPVISILEENNYVVKVSAIDHPNGSPRPLDGYVPDIYAIKNIDGEVTEIIIELYNQDNINNIDFKKIRRFLTKDKIFLIIVQKTCYSNIKLKLDSFNLKIPILYDHNKLEEVLNELDEKN